MIKFGLICITLLVFHGCQDGKETVVIENTPSAFTSNSTPSSWPESTNFPLQLHVGSNFDEAEITAINEASSAWNNSLQLEDDMFTLQSSLVESKSSLSSYYDNEFGIYKVHTWPEDLPAKALAVTQIYGSRVNVGLSNENIKIEHADILINYDYFSFSSSSSIWGYDLTTVLVHEMGHFLGLYHTNTSPEHSVMYPNLSKYKTNKNPHEYDIENIEQKYANLRSQTASRSIVGSSSKEAVIIIIELRSDHSHHIRTISLP